MTSRWEPDDDGPDADDETVMGALRRARDHVVARWQCMTEGHDWDCQYSHDCEGDHVCRRCGRMGHGVDGDDE